jgi:predicted GIY-YIG superfamily endonuclease
LSVTWYVYILRCGDGTLYTGVTNDIVRRVGEHQAGRGSRYTRAHLPVTLVGAWCAGTRAEALSTELAVKRLNRRAKLQLIERRAPFRGAPCILAGEGTT